MWFPLFAVEYMITISYKDFSHHLVAVYHMPVIFISNWSVLLIPYPSKILVIVDEHFCSACNRYATTIGELEQMVLQFSERFSSTIFYATVKLGYAWSNFNTWV